MPRWEGFQKLIKLAALGWAREYQGVTLLSLGETERQEGCVQARTVMRALANKPLGRTCPLLGVCRPHRHGLGRHLFLQLSGDQLTVQSSSDSRVAGTFDHTRQFTRFKLV